MKSRIFAGSIAAVLLWIPLSAGAATQIYYSVGQNTSDHKTCTAGDCTANPLTVTISGTTATFSAAQTATNMGVGDVVTYGGSRVFLTRKTDTSHWSVETATGTTPVATTSAKVSSISHAFASLRSAVGTGVSGNATSTSFLNTSNLVTGNYNLNIPLYYDTGSDTSAVVLAGFTTAVDKGLYIYTPTSTATQVNRSQRHNGLWSNTAYSLAPGNIATVLTLNIAYVWIDGIQINHTISSQMDVQAILFKTRGTLTDIRISNSIIESDYSALANSVNFGYIITDSNSSSTRKIWNNLIYNTVPCGCQNGVTGIGFWDYTQMSYIYNNTIAGVDQAIFNSGIAAPDVFLFKNNLSFSTTTISTIDVYSLGFTTGSGYNSTNRDDPNAMGGTNSRTLQTFGFVSTSTGDYHLTSADTGALDFGTPLNADTALAFNTDIEGDPRPYGSAWDIGADEYTPATSTVTTSAAGSITLTSAALNATITDAGRANATQSGFAWGTASNLSGGDTATTTDGSQAGAVSFTHSLASLVCNTTYYARAYATNAAGTGYGSIVTFTTTPCVPTVTTSVPSTITTTAATLNASIIATGGDNATQSGFAWGTVSTLSGGDTATTTEGAQTGTPSFTHDVSALTCNTTYYVRAYATNAGGTGVGTIQSFSTSGCPVVAAPVTAAPVVSGLGGGFASRYTAPVFAPGYGPKLAARTMSAVPVAVSAAALPAPISRGFELGSTNIQVKSIQVVLNILGFTVASAGPGSPGNETTYFGPLTAKAVQAFQLYYEIARPGDPGFGYAGPKTRAKLNQLLSK